MHSSLIFFELAETATKEELKKAYRVAASEAHPDHGGSTGEFIEVKAMYEEALKHVGVAATCETCNGEGFVISSRGFYSLRQTCRDCEGRGTVDRK
jgi:DnaJ-class molecular chaperone